MLEHGVHTRSPPLNLLAQALSQGLLKTPAVNAWQHWMKVTARVLVDVTEPGVAEFTMSGGALTCS